MIHSFALRRIPICRGVHFGVLLQARCIPTSGFLSPLISTSHSPLYSDPSINKRAMWVGREYNAMFYFLPFLTWFFTFTSKIIRKQTSFHYIYTGISLWRNDKNNCQRRTKTRGKTGTCIMSNWSTLCEICLAAEIGTSPSWNEADFRWKKAISKRLRLARK